jgi:hypothetical protein
VNASENNTCYFTPDVSEQLKHLLEQQKLTNIDANQQQNAQFFDDELNKL